jgi:hypothetical protein
MCCSYLETGFDCHERFISLLQNPQHPKKCLLLLPRGDPSMDRMHPGTHSNACM